MTSKNDLVPAINRLVDDIDKRDAETAEMKRTVNRLCGYANMPPKYADIEDKAGKGGATTRVKAGQFFRKPLATAVSSYLSMRGDPAAGGAGPGTLDEIFDALREGGFIFDAQNDSFARRSLAIAIAKNSQTFVKLPTGQFGMKSWYASRKETE